MLKKIIAILLSCSMIFTCSIQMFASENTGLLLDEEKFSFLEERTEDGLYILTTYLYGKAYDRVTIRMGSNEMLYEKFEQTSKEKITSTQSESIYYISDIIKPSNEHNIRPYAGYTIKKGNIGSVKYSAIDASGPQERTISYSSSFVDSVEGDFNVSGSEGTAWSIIFSAIVAGFSYLITASLAKAIISTVISGAGSGIISKAFTTTIRGTSYLYNVTAKTTDGRESTQGGEVYFGNIKKDGAWKNNQEVYAGYYPEFISRRDTAVASWFYQQFWGDISSVLW